MQRRFRKRCRAAGTGRYTGKGRNRPTGSSKGYERIRRYAEVPRLGCDYAAGGRSDHRHLCTFRGPRLSGNTPDADRSRQAASHVKDARRYRDRKRGRSRVGQTGVCAQQRLVRGQGHQQAGPGSVENCARSGPGPVAGAACAGEAGNRAVALLQGHRREQRNCRRHPGASRGPGDHHHRPDHSGQTRQP